MRLVANSLIYEFGPWSWGGGRRRCWRATPNHVNTDDRGPANATSRLWLFPLALLGLSGKKTPKRNKQITEMASILSVLIVTQKSAVWIVWRSLTDSTSSSFLTLSNSAVSSIFSSRRVGFLLSIFLLVQNKDVWSRRRKKYHTFLELATVVANVH